VPFSLLPEILRHPSCEVLVNFMYEEINRFLTQSDQPENFAAFFGTDQWRACVAGSPKQRNRCLHDLYVRQLRDSAGATYVRSFEMRNDAGVTDYYLFYATKSLKGLQKMKEAMWKVRPEGRIQVFRRDRPKPDGHGKRLIGWRLQIGWEAGIRTPITWSRGVGSVVGDFVSSWFCQEIRPNSSAVSGRGRPFRVQFVKYSSRANWPTVNKPCGNPGYPALPARVGLPRWSGRAPRSKVLS
jgi:hypothetical protein